MILTDSQKNIINGTVCPYCGQETKFVDSSVIYGRSYGMIYLCKPCDAYVGVHKNTKKSLGRCANRQLRAAKNMAHSAFDWIWKSGKMKRSSAYAWLSEQLGIPPQYTHIGMFQIKTCRRVVEVVKKYRKEISK